MVSKLQLRYMAEYLLATQNEIAVDINLYTLCGVKPCEFGYAPRPSRLLRFSAKKALLRHCVSGFRFFWGKGGAWLFFCLEWFRFSLMLRKADAVHLDVGQEFALGFSSRAMDLINPKSVGKELCWITFPWVPARLEGKKSFSFLSLLTPKDLLTALLLSTKSVRKLSVRSRTTDWSLQGYTAYRWFAVRLALEKLRARRLYTADHYDRWALLADGVMSSRNKVSTGIESVCGLVVLQHGLLASLDGGDISQELPFKLASKLRSVTQLYVFDNDARNIFKSSILSPLSPLKDKCIKLYQPLIDIVQVDGARKVNVLFVGHPFCEELHINIYKAVTACFDVGFYYKPHPANPCSDQVREQDWRIVEDKSIFPSVDFVISYPSTLVGEYAAVGISAVVHPLNQKNEQYNILTSTIKDKLESLACEKKITQ
ncbi:hypothetical protein KDX30_03780 [Pseudomonas sp. CDFA 553]|uniref:hypothetical protein n=1 Tax=Pseudomonas quasicaspiana TaxID=2829821 RepID=UPI001E498CAE|nr:hypothetical protein [Pseudomonas quasicaspiana]MCD5987018.1 hypothetical protein [Pseudomonas quasicaspiana]